MAFWSAIRRAPSLTVAVYGFVLLSAFVASAIMLFGIRSETRQYEHAVQSSALNMRAMALERSLSEALGREWTSLRGLAEALPAAGRDEAAQMLDMVVRGGVVAWAGLAGPSGRISVASGGEKEGTDASAEIWFRKGLEGAYAADVSSESATERAEESGPALELAHPVSGTESGLLGVLAYYIDADWPRRIVEQKASELDLDVFLLGPDQQIRLRAGNAIDAPLHLPDLERPPSSTPLGQDADGNSFLTTVRSLSVPNMPLLGWLLVARLPAQTPEEARAELTAGMITLLAGLFAEVMLATYAFIRIFIRPVRQLAADAIAISEGDPALPTARASSREAADFSRALSQIQQACAGSGAYAVPDFLSLVGERANRGDRKHLS